VDETVSDYKYDGSRQGTFSKPGAFGILCVTVNRQSEPAETVQERKVPFVQRSINPAANFRARYNTFTNHDLPLLFIINNVIKMLFVSLSPSYIKAIRKDFLFLFFP
jgi:hypothetical protein